MKPAEGTILTVSRLAGEAAADFAVENPGAEETLVCAIEAAKVALAGVSAVLFTAAHYVQGHFPDNAFVGIFLIGLFQCRIYAKTGSIWCPMLSHVLFNSLNLALLFVFPELATG